MAEVIIACIWVVGLIVVGILLWKRLKEPVQAILEEYRRSIALDNEAKQAKLQERALEAELLKKLDRENLELKQAQLRKQAAEADAEATVLRATSDARITEEQAVIAARTEGRAIAAKERAINGDKTSSALDALMQGYTAYVENGGTTDLDLWMGNLRLVGGDIVAADD